MRRLIFVAASAALVGSANAQTTPSSAQNQVPVAEEKSKIALGEYNRVPSHVPLIAPLKAEYRAYRAAVLADGNLSPDQKASLIRRRVERIRDELHEVRTNAYGARFARVAVNHSCTKGSSGGTKHCKSDKCVRPEDHNMVTSKSRAAVWRASDKQPHDIPWPRILSWEVGKWSGKEPKVLDGGTRMCAPNLKKSGKGAIRVRAFATFVYPSAYVRSVVDSEVSAMLAEIQGPG